MSRYLETMMPICRKCKQEKLENSFPKSRVSGLCYTVCIDCKKQQIKDCHYGLKRAGITLQEYQKLLNDQNNSCAICGRQVKLTVDHDHQTLAIRGLLCSNCNRGIGYLQDSIEILEKAAIYLRLCKGKQPDMMQLLARLDATRYRGL
jgi:hypothetical protein